MLLFMVQNKNQFMFKFAKQIIMMYNFHILLFTEKSNYEHYFSICKSRFSHSSWSETRNKEERYASWSKSKIHFGYNLNSKSK
jgi:hypothetical protein